MAPTLRIPALAPGGEAAERIVDWVQALATRADPQLARRYGLTPSAEWRSPVVERLSKEGYNVLAEFEAALSGEAYEDACQIITAAETQGGLGLLPDSRDRRLLVSLASAVALAMRDHPALKETMQNKFAALGQLRVRQAIAEDNVPAVTAATVQFFGSAAATTAHRWLGERALSSGDAARAVSHFLQAAEEADPGDKPPLQARLRLAGALLGRDFGSPNQTPPAIDFGGETLGPVEYEALVVQLLKQRRGAGLRLTSGETAAPDAPAPARFKPRRWAEFPGAQPADANNGRREIDWVARRINCVAVKGVLYVTDGFSLAAYALADGKQKWATPVQGAPFAHRWSGASSTPRVAGDHVFWRRFTTKGVQLVCVEAASGEVLWITQPNLQLASDPVLAPDELYAVALSSLHDRTLQLLLLAIDPADGTILAERPVAQFRDYWGGRLPCNLVAVNDTLIATLGGAVLCCDLLGRPRWLRRQEWIAPQLDSDTQLQPLSPPVIAAGRVYATQPGVRCVECLDEATGRLRWRRVLPRVRRAIDLIDEALIVETDDALLALNANNGNVLWRHATGDRFEALLSGGAGGLLYAESHSDNGQETWPRLVWLDSQTGQRTAECPLREMAAKRLRFGPLFADSNRLFAFAGEDERTTRRALYELVAQRTPPLRLVPSAAELRHWTPSVAEDLQSDAAAVLPGWSLVSSRDDKQTGWQAEFRNQPDALGVLADPQHPVRIMRGVDVPETGATKLLVQVGLEQGKPWSLEIRAAAKTFLKQEVSDKTAPSGWLTREIDLSSFAGQRIWVTVSQRCAKEPTHGYWRRLVIRTVSP